MKKLILLAFTVTILFGCNVESTSDTSNDSVGSQSNQEFRDSLRTVMETNVNAEVFGDTAGVYKSPIKVLSARLIKKEYSSYRDIKIVYKNVSGKTITAIRFRWAGVNAFNEPADMGNSMAKGYGNGFTDETLTAGKTETGQWNILSRDGKKVTNAWAYEVAFADGTKWVLKK